mmetsp:Transcript_1998/g.4756  ORF Transcript_1998/g.4756 Transcript_1998/m.4756 type:complete len:112 (+) Transcript_1998:467-802(+)
MGRFVMSYSIGKKTQRRGNFLCGNSRPNAATTPRADSIQHHVGCNSDRMTSTNGGAARGIVVVVANDGTASSNTCAAERNWKKNHGPKRGGMDLRSQGQILLLLAERHGRF